MLVRIAISVFALTVLVAHPAHARSDGDLPEVVLQAEEAFREGDFSLACARYRDAYQIDPRAEFLFEQGRCQYELARRTKSTLDATDALCAAFRLLGDAREKAERRGLRDRIDREMDKVLDDDRTVGRVRVAARPGSEVSVDGAPFVSVDDGPLALKPGFRGLRFILPGYKSGDRRISVACGVEQDVDVRPFQAALPVQVIFDVTPGDALLSLDGKKPLRSGASVELETGSHVLRARRSGYEDAVENLVVTPQATPLRVQVEMKPVGGVPRTPWYRSAAGWSVLSVGLAVAGVGGGVLLHLADAERQDVLAHIDGGELVTGISQAQAYRSWDRSDKLELAGWVAVGVGAAAVVGSVVLFALHDTRPKPSEKVRTLTLTPTTTGAGGAALVLGGSF